MLNKTFDTALEIDWTESLGHPLRLVVSTWDEGLLVQSFEDGEKEDLNVTEIGDWWFKTADLAVEQWRASFPADVKSAIELLPRHNALTAHLAVRSESVRDLLINNPFLLWCLCEQGHINSEDLGVADTLARQKQRKLCQRVGLNGTQQEVRLLRSAAAVPFNNDDLRAFFRLLKQPGVCNYLSHEKVISTDDIQLLLRQPWLANCPARSLIPVLRDRGHRRIFSDVLRMLENISALQQCKTLAALERLHDRLVVDLNGGRSKELMRDEHGHLLPIPTPPLTATETILPITSQAELIEEGREMHHCIASHLKSVVDGKFAVYRMMAPERLTIEVLVMDGRQVFLREVRGKYNRAPSTESTAIIEKWFAAGSKEFQ